MGCNQSKHVVGSDVPPDIAQQEAEQPAPVPKSLALAQTKHLEVSLSSAKEERLRTLDPFVLDNSLRETAVAAIKGQVSSDKDKILEALSGTGLDDNVIVASFGPLRRPEDVWLEDKIRRNKIRDDWWAFSEMFDPPKESDLFAAPIPSGVLRCRQYGIKNIILEVDVLCKAWDGYTVGDWKELFQNRVEYIRRFSPEAKILFNIRDAPSAYFHDPCEHDYPARMRDMIQAASSLEPKIFGLVFEDPIAEILPWNIGILSAEMKQVMEENNWKDGHLLIHVHKRFALSDAAVLEALAMGCTGIWCAVCEEGGGMGHPCSLTTLVNLARLGNENVAKRYNLRALYNAAIEITKITTGSLPHSRTEVYGSQAMDIVFAEGGMGAGAKVDLAEVVGHQSRRNIRVSTFTDEAMMRAKLNETFGDLDYEAFVLQSMIILIHVDLEHGQSLQYNGPAGLLDLYIAAGGTKGADHMQEQLLKIQQATQKTDPLIKDLREKFDSCRESAVPSNSELQKWAEKRASRAAAGEEKKEEEDSGTNTTLSVALAFAKFKKIAKVARVQDSLTYEEFYQGFLTPYHVHSPSVNPMKTKVVTDALNFLDSDQSGQIEWGELLSRAYWVLENTDEMELRRWNLKDLLNALFRNARMQDTSRTLFMRKKAHLVNKVQAAVDEDERIQNLLKSDDSNVMKIFLANVLMAGIGEGGSDGFDQHHIDPKTLAMINNLAALIFEPDHCEACVDMIFEHIHRAEIPVRSKTMGGLKQSLTSSLNSQEDYAACFQRFADMEKSDSDASSGGSAKNTVIEPTPVPHEVKAATAHDSNISVSSGRSSKGRSAAGKSSPWMLERKGDEVQAAPAAVPHEVETVTPPKAIRDSESSISSSGSRKGRSTNVNSNPQEHPKTVDVEAALAALPREAEATTTASSRSPASSASREDELRALGKECARLTRKLRRTRRRTPEYLVHKYELKYATQELEHLYAAFRAAEGGDDGDARLVNRTVVLAE